MSDWVQIYPKMEQFYESIEISLTCKKKGDTKINIFKEMQHISIRKMCSLIETKQKPVSF